ncbi:MAG: hypothetical protein KBT47_03725, partial [Armatimonadetes bacterium]|nr:hypothetical protein [Candidatus Hippobium faecium]
IANEGSYCLRLDKNTDKGWFGVNYPEMKKLPISDIQGFALDAKEGINCPEISFTVFLADKSRWNCVINISDEWKHFDLIKESFFAEENPNSLPNIDFSQIEWIWISLRPGDNSQKSTIFLDNLKIYCNAEETDLRESITIDKTANLKGVKVCVIDTDTLPLLGQSEGAVEIITSAMKKAGAKVTVCKDMKKLAATPDTVIVYESPVVNEEDFPYLEKALKKGARLVWLGVDVPFSRVVKNGEMTKQEQVYTSFSYRLTKGAFQAFDPVTNKNPFILTEAGKKVLKEFPEEFQGTKCNYLTIDDSIWLNQNYPWVEYIPLVKTDYRATNWVFLDRPFQGSVISEFVHHAGKYAGSVMIFASMSPSGSSILNPQGGAYAYLVSSLVKEASKKVVIDKNIDKIPPEPFKVTRENFFHNDFKILGGLNFNGTDLSDPDNIYALKR